MKDINQLFDELYSEFVDNCNSYLSFIDISLQSRILYDSWYKERMRKLCLDFHHSLSEVDVG